MTDTTNTTAIVEYKPIEEAIASIQRFKGLVADPKTPEGLASLKAAQREAGAVRIALEKTRKTLKEGVLERGRQIDGQAKPLFARVAEIEVPIMTQIDAEEDRIEREREAAIKAEQERLAAEERAKKEAEERRLSEERAKNEAEARRLAEERAKLEAEQRAAREKAEAEDRERRAKIEEEERAAKQRIAEAEAKAKADRQAEEEFLRAERRELEEAARAEQFRKDEEARSIRLEEQRKREAEENARAQAERERQRQEAERLDSRRMLETFCERFGHVHPELAVHIREYLAKADLKVAA